MGACRLKTSLKFEISNEIKMKLTKIFFFLSSKYLKIVRLAIPQNPIN